MENNREPEFDDIQLDRLFELTEAAQIFRKVVAETDDLAYDVEDIWELVHMCADQLMSRGRRVKIPTRVTAKNGIMYITDWHEKDEGASESDNV